MICGLIKVFMDLLIMVNAREGRFGIVLGERYQMIPCLNLLKKILIKYVGLWGIKRGIYYY